MATPRRNSRFCHRSARLKWLKHFEKLPVTKLKKLLVYLETKVENQTPQGPGQSWYPCKLLPRLYLSARRKTCRQENLGKEKFSNGYIKLTLKSAKTYTAPNCSWNTLWTFQSFPPFSLPNQRLAFGLAFWNTVQQLRISFDVPERTRFQPWEEKKMPHFIILTLDRPLFLPTYLTGLQISSSDFSSTIIFSSSHSALFQLTKSPPAWREDSAEQVVQLCISWIDKNIS